LNSNYSFFLQISVQSITKLQTQITVMLAMLISKPGYDALWLGREA
jgi:hypothetical protein